MDFILSILFILSFFFALVSMGVAIAERLIEKLNPLYQSRDKKTFFYYAIALVILSALTGAAR